MAVSDEPKKPASPLISSPDALAWLKANWPRYWEIGVLAVIVLVGAGLRLWDLGARSLNHDESLHATYSWYIYIGNGYTHDPMMHGPFQFFANAFTWKALSFLSSAPLLSNFAHWGPSDYTARLAYALFGTVFITLPFFIRSYIGRTGALFAALFIAFSPLILYFNRFARGDTYMAFWTLGIVICMWRYLVERRPLYLYLMAGLLALSFATKEVTFMLVAMFLIFLDILFAWEILGQLRERYEPKAVASEETEEARPTRRARKKQASQPASARQPGIQTWSLVFICLVPVAWLIAIAWPLTAKWRARWSLQWPASGDVLMVLGTLAAVQFAAAVQMLPFVGDKGYYQDVAGGEDTLRKMSVFALLAASAYIGLLWRPRTWLIAAAVFYAIFVLLFTTFFTNIGGFTFAEDAKRFWPAAFGVVSLLSFVLPALALLLLPDSSEESWFKRTERSLLTGAGIGYAIFAVVFVLVLVDTGFWTGIWGSFDYWLQQQDVQRGDQPVYYYLMLLPMYDFLPLAFAVAGAGWFLLRRQFLVSIMAVVAVCLLIFAYFTFKESLLGMIPVLVVLGMVVLALRQDLFTSFLIFWAGGALIAFATAGEKMPWLTIHMTVPIIILAAKSLNSLYERFRLSLPLRWSSPETSLLLAAAAGASSMIILWASGFSSTGAVVAVVLGIAAAGLILRAITSHGALVGAQTAAAVLIPALFVFTVHDSIRANFEIGDWPREMLSYADTSPGMSWARDQLVDLGNQSGLGRDYPVVIDNEVAWPMVWYMRDYSPQWASDSMAPPVTGSLVILGSQHETWMEPYLDQYEAPVSVRHLWWFGDGPQFYGDMTSGGFVKALFDKDVWDVWRNYFVWRETPWEPPPDDTLVYLPKTLATGGSTVYKAPPPIPTVTVAPESQAVIGAGQLNAPTDVTVDATGNIYVSDSGTNSVKVFGSDGTLLRTLQPSGDETLKEPWSVAVGADGSIYVADTWNFRVAKYDSNLNLLWPTQSSVAFYGPRDLLPLPDGSVLVADTGNKRIVKLGANGDVVAAYGAGGSGPGQFNEPVGLAFGPNGYIYVADTWNGRVQIFDSAFEYLSEFKVKGWGSQEVTAKPYLVVLADGRVIISSPTNGRVELYDQQGQPVIAWELPAAQNGAKGRPVGLALDGQGFLYIADIAGNQVYRLPVAGLTGP